MFSVGVSVPPELLLLFGLAGFAGLFGVAGSAFGLAGFEGFAVAVLGVALAEAPACACWVSVRFNVGFAGVRKVNRMKAAVSPESPPAMSELRYVLFMLFCRVYAKVEAGL